MMIQLEKKPNDKFIIQVYMSTSKADNEKVEDMVK